MDVDYYSFVPAEDLEVGSSSTTWNIFVDAEPMKGWEHNCYVITIPKSVPAGKSVNVQTVARRLPPAVTMRPLSVKNRYGSNANVKPNVKKSTLSNADQAIANRTYAVILSGGVNKNSNYERYWNDCAFVYQTLTAKYGVPKNNISVIMADGTNPAVDMRLASGGYASSPLDLDGDGSADIKYAATRSNVKAAIDQYAAIWHRKL